MRRAVSTSYRVRSLVLQPLSAENSTEFSQADNSRTIRSRIMNLTSLGSLGSWEVIYVYLKTQKSGKNMNKITLKTTGTQFSIYFGHSQESKK